MSWLLVLSLITATQDAAVITAVRAAMAPALQYPATDDSGTLPAGNDTEAQWMVRPAEAGDTSIEVLANPLNQLNQLNASRAMAKIENNIESAQRRAADSYEQALSEARRTGKSQAVETVTLSDEGVDGEKIDAESHVTIDVLFNQAQYHFPIAGRMEPAANLPFAFPFPHIDVVAHTYKQDPHSGPEHYKEREFIVFLGPVAAPSVTNRGLEPMFDLTVNGSAAARTMAVRIRGNKELVAEIAAKTNWNALLELLK
jgi:hypothetical protein